MKKTIVAFALGVLPAFTAQAQNIIYTFSGTGSGAVGGAAFTDSSFTIRVFADTNDVIDGPGDLISVEDISSELEISGIGIGIFTEDERIFTINNALGFSRGASRDGGEMLEMLDLFSADFIGYDLRSPLPPVFVSEAFAVEQFFNEPSTLGGVTFTAIRDVTFTANAVPEPSSAAMLGTALFGMLLPGRRRPRTRQIKTA